MGTIGGPETSVLYQTTLRNIPEDDKIQVNRSESLLSCLFASCFVLFYGPTA
jgi:hypothetical protein